MILLVKNQLISGIYYRKSFSDYLIQLFSLELGPKKVI